MKYKTKLIHGRLLKRYKRFLADVRLDSSEVVTAHCANPGSMIGLLEENAQAFLSESQNPKRKLKFTWELVKAADSWVGVHPALANKIAEEAIREGYIRELKNCRNLRREVKYGENSRADFLLEMQDRSVTYVEVKSVTLAENSHAQFPDAVTKRGLKHLEELMRVVKNGDRAAMLFVVQREDVRSFEPAWEIDPEYAKTLATAASQGVEVIAYDCAVSPEAVTLRNALPVNIKNPES